MQGCSRSIPPRWYKLKAHPPQLHLSRDTCRIARCKLYSLPLSLFAHFSSVLRTHMRPHVHTDTHIHKGVPGSVLNYCCRKARAIVVVVTSCTVSGKCDWFLRAVCIRHSKEGKGREPVCVLGCVCAMALLCLNPVMWIHNPIPHKNFVEWLHWEIIPLCHKILRKNSLHAPKHAYDKTSTAIVHPPSIALILQTFFLVFPIISEISLLPRFMLANFPQRKDDCYWSSWVK